MKKSHGFASPTSIVWCVSRVISQFSAHMPAPSTCMYSCYQMSRESHKSRSVGHLWNIPPYPSLWGNLLRYGCTAVHPHILCDPEWLLPLSISIFETFINQSFYFPEAKIVAASLYLLFQSHTVSLLSPSVYEPSAVARQPVNSEEKVEELLDEILLLLFLSPPPWRRENEELDGLFMYQRCWGPFVVIETFATDVKYFRPVNRSMWNLVDGGRAFNIDWRIKWI